MLSGFQDENPQANEVIEAVVEIYLFKGVHHFINCINKDEISITDLPYAEWMKDATAILCFDETQENPFYDPDVDSSNMFSYSIGKPHYNDNVKYVI